jgi:hypothetical protein
MKLILVDDNEEYPECPLRSDLHSCQVMKNSDINSCPSLNDDDVLCLPDWCPLKNGGVFIHLKTCTE